MCCQSKISELFATFLNNMAFRVMEYFGANLNLFSRLRIFSSVRVEVYNKSKYY